MDLEVWQVSHKDRTCSFVLLTRVVSALNIQYKGFPNKANTMQEIDSLYDELAHLLQLQSLRKMKVPGRIVLSLIYIYISQL